VVAVVAAHQDQMVLLDQDQLVVLVALELHLALRVHL
jgi:hypothetical protein